MTLQQLASSAKTRWWLIPLIFAACIGLGVNGVGAVEQTPIVSAQLRVKNDLNLFGSNVTLERPATKVLEELNAESRRRRAILAVLPEVDETVLFEMSASRILDDDIIRVEVSHPSTATGSLIANAWLDDYVADQSERIGVVDQELATLEAEREATFEELLTVLSDISRDRLGIAAELGTSRIINTVPPIVAAPELFAQQSRITAQLRSIAFQVNRIRIERSQIQISQVVNRASSERGVTFPLKRFGMAQWIVAAIGLSLAAVGLGARNVLSPEEALSLTHDAQTGPSVYDGKSNATAINSTAALIMQYYRAGTRVFAFNRGGRRPADLAEWLSVNGYEVELVAASKRVAKAGQLTRPDFERTLRDPEADDDSSIILVELADVRAKHAGPERHQEVLAIVEIEGGQTTEQEAVNDLRMAGRVADRTIAIVA